MAKKKYAFILRKEQEGKKIYLKSKESYGTINTNRPEKANRFDTAIIAEKFNQDNLDGEYEVFKLSF